MVLVTIKLSETPVTGNVKNISINVESSCPADYDKNSFVDQKDLDIFTENYKSYEVNCSYDLIREDCFLDLKDFLVFAGQFNKSCNGDSLQPITTELLAFPSALGLGKNTVGGRGGKVIYVTNLNDSGPGSLRDAVQTSGPRTVVFSISGVIKLESKLSISNDNITIAGQTAPGGGIVVAGNTTEITADEVIIRHIRFRMHKGNYDPENADTLFIKQVENVILDHVSISWGIDENFSIQGSNVTVQHSIISEGVNNAGHTEGAHSKGVFVNSSNANNITFYGNLISSNKDRNPLISGGSIEFLNNVIYNFDSTPFTTGRDSAANICLIGNHLVAGPNTSTDGNNRYTFRFDSPSNWNNPIQVFFQSNLGLSRQDNSKSEYDICRKSSSYDPSGYECVHFGINTENKFDFCTTSTLSSQETRDYVINNAGAFPRDSVDSRLINEVPASGFIGSLGSIPNVSQNGWPALPIISEGVPYTDLDKDGISDEWELNNGLDPNNYSDSILDRNSDGYTNLEEFLNSL